MVLKFAFDNKLSSDSLSINNFWASKPPEKLICNLSAPPKTFLCA